jgi:hypothetical protein
MQLFLARYNQFIAVRGDNKAAFIQYKTIGVRTSPNILTRWWNHRVLLMDIETLPFHYAIGQSISKLSIWEYSTKQNVNGISKLYL